MCKYTLFPFDISPMANENYSTRKKPNKWSRIAELPTDNIVPLI